MMSRLTDHIEALADRGHKEAFVYQAAFRTFRWSYIDLHRDIRKAAEFLGKLGVNQGDRVIIWAPNSPYWGMAFLGALYCGATPVPAEVGAATDFIRDIARETEAKAVFRSNLLDDPGLDIPVRLIEDLPDDIEDLRGRETPADVGEDDIAQILYTSGTTGAPKGVILTHRNIASNLESIEQAIEIGPDHLLISILPLSHVFEQVSTFWTALNHGATVVYVQVLKPSELFKALSNNPVTVLAVVPEFLSLIQNRIRGRLGEGMKRRAFETMLRRADSMPSGARKLMFYPVHSQIGRSFEFFIVGAARLEEENEDFWRRMGFLVLQGYGLSEASPVVTVNRRDARKPGSVGQALPGVEVRVAEDGEILVRGENVSPGYFMKPEETPDTFKDGWLHTGDVGELDADGFLYVKGRKKDVIVTRAGLNVYPPDVEAAIGAQPGVRDVAVLEHRDTIHAALLLDDSSDPARLIEQANSRLAEHQRARGHTVWPDEDFPRSATRKPKKHEIKERLEQLAQNGARQAPPAAEDGATSDVMRIVARVSGKPAPEIEKGSRLGKDLGLDSVGRLQLVGVLEQTLNREVAEEALREETTVEQLEGLLAQEPAKEREFARWARSRPVRAGREALQTGLMFPLYRLLVRQSTIGLERLKELEAPVIFAPNHTSHLDSLAMYRAFPTRFRRRMAVAQLAEFFEAQTRVPGEQLARSLAFYFFTIGFNIFPLPRTRAFRRSLQYTGELIDHGWNILVYPEGHQSYTGELEPFHEGIGVMAGEMRVPVVPVHIQGMYEILPRHRRLPRPGRVSVLFGDPMRLRKESYAGFTSRLEEAVRELGQNHPQGAAGRARRQAPRPG